MRYLFTVLLFLSLGLHIDAAWDVPSVQPGAMRVLVIHAASDQSSALHIEALLPDDMAPLTTEIDHGGACLSHGCNVVVQPGETVTMTETVQFASGAAPGLRTITVFVDDDQMRSSFTEIPLTIMSSFRIYLPVP